MKIGRGRTFYWDTCIFLHWLSDPVKDRDVVDGIEDVIAMTERGNAVIFTSTITRIEVLRAKLTDDAAEKFVKLFPRPVEWVNVDPRVAQLAHDIRSFYSVPDMKDMSVPDCIHLATAIIYEADEMHTLDGSGKQRRHDLIPLSGNVMNGKYKLPIVKPRRVPPPPPVEPPPPPLFQLLEKEGAAGDAGDDGTQSQATSNETNVRAVEPQNAANQEPTPARAEGARQADVSAADQETPEPIEDESEPQA